MVEGLNIAIVGTIRLCQPSDNPYVGHLSPHDAGLVTHLRGLIHEVPPLASGTTPRSGVGPPNDRP